MGHGYAETSAAKWFDSAKTIVLALTAPRIDEGQEILKLTYQPRKQGNDLIVEGLVWRTELTNFSDATVAAVFRGDEPVAFVAAIDTEHDAATSLHGGSVRITKRIKVESMEPIVLSLRAGPNSNDVGRWGVNYVNIWQTGGERPHTLGDPESESEGLTSFLRVTEIHRE